MEEVIYGVMFNAKIDIVVNEPPVKASKKLNASPVFLENQSLKTLLSTPGIGSCEPILIIRIMPTT